MSFPSSSNTNNNNDNNNNNNSHTKWHAKQSWQEFLKIYDRIVQEQFGDDHNNNDCGSGGTNTNNHLPSSRLINTDFGQTQIHTKGNPTHPILVLFHGISSNSLMFGEWLIPKLSQRYYTICVDTIGDLGRSIPRDGDPVNGPKDDKELAFWALQVCQGVLGSNWYDDIDDDNDNDGGAKKVNLIGYSFGCYIASCIGRYYPKVVHKMILLAPVGVVGPVRKMWLLQAIGFTLVASCLPQEGYVTDRLRHWFFGSMMVDPEVGMKQLKYPELRMAMDALGGPKTNVQPIVINDDDLSQMVRDIPTLMICGGEESVVDAKVSIETARRCHMTVVVYENAGHMLFCEHPRETIIDEILTFMEQT